MFKWPFKKQEIKPIIVCIHGFGRRKSIEFIPLVTYLSDYECINIDLYDQTNKDDDQYSLWISRAENALTGAITSNRRVILIGFSMGGVIASHLASKYKIEKLILIAPAFEYFTLKTATNAISNALSRTKIEDEFVDLPKSFTSAFTTIVDLYKEDIHSVSCPILFIHATQDGVIPSHISTKIYNKLTNKNKTCICLQGGSHRLLNDTQLAPTVLYLIQGFIENKL